ncbi:HAD family hydrolase [Noviherbaspirillum sp.]|uniref:HAD family hydrolase n=1 Tax=Noviherbaspirillum sp. TaxID=1926288 RepID=UPI002B48436D|nr:HAD family hydrolase [Noviherbaspirillum sp.]HJV83363.1 HAD family hydrolase [Noviherbaspirillum sp.]
MGIEALILGLDGVILETEAAHLDACNEAFARCGLGLRWSLAQLRQASRVWGATNAVAALIDKLGLPVASKEAVQLMQEKNTLFRDIVLARRTELNPACAALMEDALQHGCKLAVVTDMPAQTATTLLDRAFGNAVTNMFSAVVSGADLNGSSDNGPCQLVLRTVGIDAEACIAIDAGAPGLRAAQCAGIWTMAIGPYEKDIARISGADVWCPQWQELRHWIKPGNPAQTGCEPCINFDSLRALRRGRRVNPATFKLAAPVQLAA